MRTTLYDNLAHDFTLFVGSELPPLLALLIEKMP
jgi:hypothetical protein